METVHSGSFLSFLPYWGYPTMLLLMIAEGPVATISAAFLASLGYFNIFAVYFLSIAGDVIGDIILFYIGYFGGTKIIPRVQKILSVSDETVEKLKSKFHGNSEKIIFYVKSTTGLSYIAFITAGALKMNFLKFVKNSVKGGFIWSALLVVIGYFFGYSAEKISGYIQYAGFFIFALAIITLFILNNYKKNRSKKII